jgi:hypothetical protein
VPGVPGVLGEVTELLPDEPESGEGWFMLEPVELRSVLLGEPVLPGVPLGGVMVLPRLLPELVLCAIADALDRASAATPARR